MKPVLLSADSKVCLYAVPDTVAEHLEQYCLDFCVHWIWEDPRGAKLLVTMKNGALGAVYGVQDFIDYLNEWVFPGEKSTLIRQLDFYGYEIPAAYQQYPSFNF